MNQKKKERLEAAIKKKKECCMKAMSIVEHFMDVKLDEETFLGNLQYINQCHFQDIVDERSIEKLCGYPLCDVTLTNVPNKQYHISTLVNKVYDITERKKFCSNYCYKASVYIKEQMFTSPLWLRHSEVIPQFKLLRRNSCTNDRGEEVVMWDQGLRTEIENDAKENSCENIKDLNDVIKTKEDDESENKLNRKKLMDQTVCENENKSLTKYGNEYGVTKEEMKVNDTKREKKILKSNEIPMNSSKPSVRRLEQCMKEWITFETVSYLMGKEHVVNVLKERGIQIKEDGNSPMVEKYYKLCGKINKVQLIEEMTSVNDEFEERKALPDYETLREEANRMQLKVKEFLNSGKKVTFDESTITSKNDEEDKVPVLPLLDQYSQNVIRKKILSDKLKASLYNMSVLLRLDASNVIMKANKLLNTFSLSSHNVMFRNAECIIISIILIKLLSIKDENIGNSLKESGLAKLLNCNNIPNAEHIEKYSSESFLFDLVTAKCLN